MPQGRPSGGSHDGHADSVTIGVADEHIGAIVGRGGRNIMEISQVRPIPPLFLNQPAR